MKKMKTLEEGIDPIKFTCMEALAQIWDPNRLENVEIIIDLLMSSYSQLKKLNKEFPLEEITEEAYRCSIERIYCEAVNEVENKKNFYN